MLRTKNALSGMWANKKIVFYIVCMENEAFKRGSFGATSSSFARMTNTLNKFWT